MPFDDRPVIAGDPAMTIRQRYESALDEWTRSVTALQVALSDFMDDGLQTRGGTWILTMSQTKADRLGVARRRADAAKAALDRIVDDLQMPQKAPLPRRCN